MRRRAKVDGNHSVIVATLTLHGWRVLSLAEIGRGCPDVLAYHPGRKEWRLVEIKDGAAKKLTKDQVTFMDRGWPVTVIRSVDDAIRL